MYKIIHIHLFAAAVILLAGTANLKAKGISVNPTSLSYSYTGNRRSTFGYDINGNVTNDATNSLQTSYNLLNLP